MTGAAASAPPSVRYPGSAPDPRPSRSGETITNGWLILAGDGLIGAGESLEAARTDVRRRLDAVGVVLTWEPVDQRRTYPCTGAAVAAAWEMLDNHRFPRRLERLQLLTGEDRLIYTISQACEACGGPDSPTGGPGGYCEACDSTGRVRTDVDAAPEHLAAAVGAGRPDGLPHDRVVDAGDRVAVDLRVPADADRQRDDTCPTRGAARRAATCSGRPAPAEHAGRRSPTWKGGPDTSGTTAGKTRPA